MKQVALIFGCLALSASGAWAQQSGQTPPPPPNADQLINSAGNGAMDQLEGDYGNLMRDETIPLGMVQSAWDDAPANAGTYRVEHSPEKVIKVRTRQYMTTTIRFPQWETIGYVDAGDSFAFDIEQTRPNIIRVRATRPGGDTNLTAIGESGNAYIFYLRGEGHNSDEIPDLLVEVRAVNPSAGDNPSLNLIEDQSASTGVPQRSPARYDSNEDPAGNERGSGLEDPDFLEEIPFDPTELRFDFTMTGDRTIAPERVFSDGIFTYFDYGDRWNRTDLPAVYRVVDGVDTPQNMRYQGNMVVVESTGAFTLRNGKRVVCVRPDGWTAGEKAERADRNDLGGTPLPQSGRLSREGNEWQGG